MRLLHNSSEQGRQHFEENEYEWKNLLNRIYGYRADHDGFQPVSLIGEYAHRFSDCPHTNRL